jgi:chemotaxis protein MotB
MARKKKKAQCEEMAPWLITFTDVMTLMLTFFVLLVSMAKVDERRKLVVLGSIIGTFGFHDQSYRVYTRTDTRRTVEPGPIDQGDLMPLKPLMWDYAEQDLDFRSSRFVQVLSVNADVLFGPGGAVITPEGERFLQTVLPTLSGVEYPLLLAGHTSELRDELGRNYNPGDADMVPDLSWKISLNRALAVYRWLIDNGMDPNLLKVEGFGKFKPHWSQNTAATRAKNRRVDFVLDKRSSIERDRIEDTRETEPQAPGTVDVDGFIFDVRDDTPEQ